MYIVHLKGCSKILELKKRKKWIFKKFKYKLIKISDLNCKYSKIIFKIFSKFVPPYYTETL